MTDEGPEGGTLHSDEPQSMAALLEAEDAPFTELRRGDILEGTVVGTDREAILVDIGAKSEGIIPPNEMNCLQPEGPSKLDSGEKVLVFVLQPESSEGQIILSLDRARGEQGWRVLQEYLDENKSFEGYVTGSNKGGLLVNVEGVNAFVPLSQIASGRPERGSPEVTERALAEWVGRTLTLKVIELNRRRNRAIVSERAAVQEKRAAEKERLLQELTEGDIRNGRITSIRDFGIFVDVGGADGLVHLSELSWDRTPKSPQELFGVGDEVEVFVLKVDQESKKIALSLRRAQPERWEEIVADYREGQIVPGQVTKLAPFGAFVRLDGPVEGLIHISELVDRRINHPKEVVSEDDVVPVKIVRIEHDRHRLGLSLRQARDNAEEDGWVFNEAGGVADPLPDALERLGVEAPPKREPEPTAAAPSEEPREEEPEGEPTIAQSLPEAAAELRAEAAAEEAASAEAAAEPEAAVEETATEEPEAAVEETATEEPATEPEAAVEETATEEPAAEPEAAVEETATEEPAAEPEAVEETATEEPAAEPEAAVEETATEEPAAEPEAVEETVTEEPAAEPEAAVEETAAEEPAAEPEAAVEETAAEEPAAVEETAEEASSEETETESASEEEPAVTDEASDALNKQTDESAGEESAESEAETETPDSEKDESSG